MEHSAQVAVVQPTVAGNAEETGSRASRLLVGLDLRILGLFLLVVAILPWAQSVATHEIPALMDQVALAVFASLAVAALGVCLALLRWRPVAIFALAAVAFLDMTLLVASRMNGQTPVPATPFLVVMLVCVYAIVRAARSPHIFAPSAN